jgi:hypothetical protein
MQTKETKAMASKMQKMTNEMMKGGMPKNMPPKKMPMKGKY